MKPSGTYKRIIYKCPKCRYRTKDKDAFFMHVQFFCKGKK